MTTPKENALRQQGENNTKRINYIGILADVSKLVKKKVKRIVRSFRKNGASSATIQFSQEITTPDGVALHVALNDKTVSLADKNGNIVEFSAYLVPELRASLLEVEGKFGRGI